MDIHDHDITQVISRRLIRRFNGSFDCLRVQIGDKTDVYEASRMQFTSTSNELVTRNSLIPCLHEATVAATGYPVWIALYRIDLTMRKSRTEAAGFAVVGKSLLRVISEAVHCELLMKKSSCQLTIMHPFFHTDARNKSTVWWTTAAL